MARKIVRNWKRMTVTINNVVCAKYTLNGQLYCIVPEENVEFIKHVQEQILLEMVAPNISGQFQVVAESDN